MSKSRAEVNNYPKGTAAYVEAHGTRQRQRGRGPSVSYKGIRNARAALVAAQADIAAGPTNLAHTEATPKDEPKAAHQGFYVHETLPLGQILAGDGKYICFTPDGEVAFSEADVNIPVGPNLKDQLRIVDAIQRIRPIVEIGGLAIEFQPDATKLLELQEGAHLRIAPANSDSSQWHPVPGPELIQFFESR